MKTITLPGFTADTRPDDKPSIVVFATENCGKAQPLDSLVLTPDGWVTIGSLRVGDLVTCPSNTVAPIVAVYPQGRKEILEFTFRDGRKVKCCEEHLWPIYRDAWRRNGQDGFRIQTAKQVEEWMASNPPSSQMMYVPLTNPIIDINRTLSRSKLPIDPYLLGALLGDGGLTGCTPYFSDDDPHVVAKVQSKIVRMGLKMNGPDSSGLTYSLVDPKSSTISPNRLTQKLRDLELYGKSSLDKFIPDMYLQASAENRWELLQGLMDTDGTVDSRGTNASFSSSSEYLIMGVQDIVWSLGGESSVSSKIPTYTHKGEKRQGEIAYRVSIRIPYPSRLFSSPRQLSKINDNGRAQSVKLRIEEVKRVGVEEAVCIAIDHPKHLYLTDNFVVTHNTRFGCTAPHDNGYIGFICLDKNSKRTVEEMKARYDLPVIVNDHDYITDKQAMKLARLDGKEEKDLKEILDIYSTAVAKITDDLDRLMTHKDVESVVIDQASQLFDYILFSHFGRKNQIESFSRAAPNQDMIDIINMLRYKNSVLIHKATEVWKDTGEKDFKGRPKQTPSGAFKPEGFGKIGGLVTAVIQLESKKLKALESDPNQFEREEILKKKYRCRVITCKGNTLLEGRDLGDEEFVNAEGDVVEGVSGEDISWGNVLRAIGVKG